MQHMRTLILLAALFLLTVSAKNCNDPKQGNTLYKGRLEIKALCMNYTIKVLEGNIDTAHVAASWTDESTGKAYTNVFALDSRCTFPADIREGDEFYFYKEDSPDRNCAVCMAYYPTPPKSMAIKVVKR